MTAADDRCNGLIPGLAQADPTAIYSSPTAMNQPNQNAAAKPRAGPPQKPVIERAPRSLFLFTLDSKFRKG